MSTDTILTLHVHLTDQEPDRLNPTMLRRIDSAARALYRTEFYSRRTTSTQAWNAAGEDDLGFAYAGELVGRTRGKPADRPVLARIVAHVKQPAASPEAEAGIELDNAHPGGPYGWIR